MKYSTAKIQIGPLTYRESEILILIAKEGLSNTELADRLYISKSTVKNHIMNIYNKLKVDSDRKAIVYYYQTYRNIG